MKLIVPEYFYRFKCVADKCKDSCCIGWEIGIDRAAKDTIMSKRLADGSHISSHIDCDRGCFILGENGKCPFLDERGLCRIINDLGEDALPEICREHPRYYSVFPDKTEGGIALCCEAGAKLILDTGLPISFKSTEHPDSNDGKPEGFDPSLSKLFEYGKRVREELFSTLFYSATSTESLIGELYAKASRIDDEAFCVACGIPYDEKATASGAPDILSFTEILSGLEALDASWHKNIGHVRGLFENATDISRIFPSDGVFADCFRKVCFYFIHRYFLLGIYDDSLGARLRLAIFSSLFILSVAAATGAHTLDRIALIAKDYSKNLEYSEDNIAALIDSLQ